MVKGSYVVFVVSSANQSWQVRSIREEISRHDGSNIHHGCGPTNASNSFLEKVVNPEIAIGINEQSPHLMEALLIRVAIATPGDRFGSMYFLFFG